MRDIIEEYMEDIKKFGEMGSTSKPMEETEGEEKHLHDHDKKQSSSLDYKGLDDDFQHYRRDSSLDHDVRDSNRNVRMVKDSTDGYSEIHDARRRSSHSREHHQREMRDFEEASEEGSSRRSHRNGSKSHEERFDKRERYGHEYDNRKRGRDEDYREHRDSGRIKRNRDDRERNEEDRRHRDRERRKSNRNSSSRPERHSSEFEDRYDPVGSGEVY